MNLLILVVDDEPDVEMLFRQQFRHDLRSGRFTMDFAQSGNMALHRIADAKGVSLILILSDINMPGMTGLELLPKAKAARPDVPVIMITAYGDAVLDRDTIGLTRRKALDFAGQEKNILKTFPSMARQDCKTARGLPDRQAQRSANQKGWLEFLDSYLGSCPRTLHRLRGFDAGERAALGAALSVLPPNCDPGATGGRIRAEALESYPSRKVSVGARNSKFWRSGAKIYLKRTGLAAPKGIC